MESTSLNQLIAQIKSDVHEIAQQKTTEKLEIYSYGATDIDPKYLVIWVCTKTDTTKMHLENDRTLMDALRKLLETHQYPLKARKHVHIGFESQETVDRVSGGNWYHHFK